jgi:hypothetical protein
MAVRTLPRDPPGEGGAKTKNKNNFKHSQVKNTNEMSSTEQCQTHGDVIIQY